MFVLYRSRSHIANLWEEHGAAHVTAAAHIWEALVVEARKARPLPLLPVHHTHLSL